MSRYQERVSAPREARSKPDAWWMPLAIFSATTVSCGSAVGSVLLFRAQMQHREALSTWGDLVVALMLTVPPAWVASVAITRLRRP